MTVTTDILIRSYWRDFAWLTFCLRAIERHCHGFRHVILAVPRGSAAWLSRHAALPSHVRLELCSDYADDYLGQQVTKMHADELSDADLICHVDSDCIFARPTSPESLAPLRRPRIYMRALEHLPANWPWVRPTEKLLGERPTHDYMQCPPFVYPRWLYGELRSWCLRTRDMTLERWILSQPARGFSEFNVLGAFARRHYRESFDWVRAEDIGEEERACRWYWSWNGLDAATRTELQRLVS